MRHSWCISVCSNTRKSSSKVVVYLLALVVVIIISQIAIYMLLGKKRL